MNAEFLRNIWLELTPRRTAQMVVVLGLILLTTETTSAAPVAEVARVLFYGIVILWGTRSAAQAVVGEIRERTWEFQRLSALTPFEMTWGKLFGATSYVWLGGLICLAVMLAGRMRYGPAPSWHDLFYYPALGLFAHAIALFASLIAIRRRQTRTQFNVFQYQAAGVGAGYVVWQAQRSIASAGSPDVEWWGMQIGGEQFFLASLAVFLAWALVGCYRLMRQELQVENAPTVWLAFILFMAVYAAGFADLSFVSRLPIISDAPPLKLAIAHAVLVALTYVAVLFEPKDRVLYRWLGEMLAKGRTAAVLSRLQCWMVAYATAVLSGAALAAQLTGADPATLMVLNAPMVIAGLGFLTRDIGVFLLFGLAPGQKRGDMPAVIALGVLYLLLPVLLGASGSGGPALLFYPLPTGGGIGALCAWAQALAVWFLVVRTRGHRTTPVAATPVPHGSPPPQ
jgi:hypothetical protein